MTLKESDILDLPNAPDFYSQTPRFTMEEMMEYCEKLLPYFNALRYSKPQPPFLGEVFRFKGEDEITSAILPNNLSSK